jgi:hypothetical protein
MLKSFAIGLLASVFGAADAHVKPRDFAPQFSNVNALEG